MTIFDKNKYFETKEFKVLLGQYEKAVSQGEPVYLEPEELTDIAEYYQDAGRDKDALCAVNCALSIFPNALSPLLFLARYSLLCEDNPTKAKEYASRIIDKEDIDYYYLIGEILLYENRPIEADRYLEEKYRLIDVEDMSDFQYDVAALFLDYNATELGKKWIEKNADKNGVDYLEIIARISAIKQQYDEAEGLYNRLIDLDPYSTYYWTQLAAMQYANNKLKEALQSSEYALAIDPKLGDALSTKANCLFLIGHYTEALDFYARYLRTYPQDAYCEKMMGATCEKLSKLEEALIHYDKAIALLKAKTPETAELYKTKALLLNSLGKTQEAFNAIEYLATFPEINRSELLVLKGYLLLENGYYEESMDEFAEAMTQSKNDSLIILQIGVAFFDHGYYDLAYDYIQRVTINQEKSDSNDVQYGWAYMAVCCIRKNKISEFLYALKKACELNPPEVAGVFFNILEPTTAPSDYYEYIKNKLLK